MKHNNAKNKHQQRLITITSSSPITNRTRRSICLSDRTYTYIGILTYVIVKRFVRREHALFLWNALPIFILNVRSVVLLPFEKTAFKYDTCWAYRGPTMSSTTLRTERACRIVDVKGDEKNKSELS